MEASSPSLGGGSDGTQADGVPKHEGAVPFMVVLVCESIALLFVQLGDGVIFVGVTGNEGRSTEQSRVLGHTVRFGEGLSIEDGLLFGTALWRTRENQRLKSIAQ